MHIRFSIFEIREIQKDFFDSRKFLYFLSTRKHLSSMQTTDINTVYTSLYFPV